MKKTQILITVIMIFMTYNLLGKNRQDYNWNTTMSNYEILQKPEITIMGIECRTSNAPEAGPQDIPKLWERFFNEEIMSQIPHKSSNEIIALYCDYESDCTLSYSIVIGCPISTCHEIPEGLVVKEIPSGTYAVFHAVGEHPQSLIKTWEHIWQQRDLQRTYTGDYEVYGDKFVSGSPKEVDVFIAIK